MTKKFFIISLCTLLTVLVASWEIAHINNKQEEINHSVQAIPVIRFECYDEHRNALIIGLFNPGTLAMEIYRTELYYQLDNKLPRVAFNHQEYNEKPLVLDPGDTILIPLQKKKVAEFQMEKGNYWGELNFQIPGQADFYSLHHRFGQNLLPQPKIQSCK